MAKLTIRDIDVKGKKCLTRVDFNVPMVDGAITDENRINGALPTIKYLAENGAKVILCSHMGKPHNIFTEGFALTKKEKKAIDELATQEEKDAKKAELIAKALKGDPKKFTLKPVADRLQELLPDIKVTFATDLVGDDAKAKVAAMKDGEIVLLENTRFEAGEEANDEALCKKLAEFCDVYVNDAFGTAHRAHATTAGIVQYGYAKVAVSGFLIEKELMFLGNAVEKPVRPFLAILGGAKIADKLNVIDNLLNKCDSLIIGGGMAYTFIKAKGGTIGNSIVDDDKIEYCLNMLKKADELGKKIYLPIDTATVAQFPDPIDAPVEVQYVETMAIPDGREGMDIGPKTRELFAKAVKEAKTIVWNGPMGVFENPTCAEGTMAVAKAMAETEATTIIGGGDSAAAVVQLGYADKMTHISTGGGASLEFLEGKVLPGIACLNDAE